MRHDVVVASAEARVRGQVGLVTNRGRVVRLQVLDLPALPPVTTLSLAGGVPVSELVALEAKECVVGLTALPDDGAGSAPVLTLGTRSGVVKRVTPEAAPAKDAWSVIALKPGDEVIGAMDTGLEEELDLVFISDAGQLLRFSSASVRPQGRGAAGMTGIKLPPDAAAVFFGPVRSIDAAQVITVAGSSSALPGTAASSVKVTPFTEFPAKGRATGGVRCHRFLKGEDVIELAWAGVGPARAAGPRGAPVALPEPDPRRDGSGSPATAAISAVAGPTGPSQ
jgi:DNA gyrase subunit A